MNPSKEICQFIIKNTKSLESGGALEAVEKAVFTAINSRMENGSKLSVDGKAGMSLSVVPLTRRLSHRQRGRKTRTASTGPVTS